MNDIINQLINRIRRKSMKDFISIVKENLNISQHTTLKVALYEAFKKTIVLGEIPSGERINEKELSEKLNISRTPIRHALKKLEDEKLVVRKHGSGVIVKGISQKDANEIYDIRKALDTLATTTAAKKMTEEDFDELEELLSESDEYFKNKEIELLLKSFKRFNQYLYEKSEMKRLAEIINELREYLSYFRDMSITSDVRSGPALDDHWIIYHTMRTNNWKDLEKIVHRHLDDSRKFILEEMERRNIE